ncbi:hypothetical protein EIP86_005068 [Pleurotus ostreatoroseus]|nr:hypothetical protein EIP86_005068 [Pleurotus ostreatoroseus]
MHKAVVLPTHSRRAPVLGAEHVLASVPAARLCFFREPVSTERSDSDIQDKGKPQALVKYVPPALEVFRVRTLLEGITPAVLERAVALVDVVKDDMPEEIAEEEQVQDASETYDLEVFRALFYPPSFLYTVFEDFRTQAREALVLSIVDPVTKSVLAPVPVDLVLLIAEKVVACRSSVTEAVDVLPSTVNESAASSPPSSATTLITRLSISPSSTPSTSSRPRTTVMTPFPSAVNEEEDSDKENVGLATPSPTPARSQERARPRVLMPFVNRLVGQQQSSNARIPLTGQAATPSPRPRSGRKGKKNGKNAPRTPLAPVSTPQRSTTLVTPSPTPSPSPASSSTCPTPTSTPLGGKGNAACGGSEKHWRRRRSKKASPLGDNGNATATPAQPKPLAQ